MLDRSLVLQEFQGPGFSRQSAHEGGKFASATCRLSLPSGRDIPVSHFCLEAKSNPGP